MLSRFHRLWLLLAVIALVVSPALCQNAQQGTVTVVDAGYNRIMGGSIDGKLVDEPVNTAKLPKKSTYTFYNYLAQLGTAEGLHTLTTTEDEEELHFIEFAKPPVPLETEDNLIMAINAPWNALPRTPVEFSTNSAVYLQAVKQYLNTTGLLLKPPVISRIWRVDLEGDKTDEVLIAASSVAHVSKMPEDNTGYYSIILLRKLIKGTVKTIPVATNYYTNMDGLYFYTLDGCFDLNGDGTLEIVTRWHSDAGDPGGSVYQLINGKVVEKMRYGGWAL